MLITSSVLADVAALADDYLANPGEPAAVCKHCEEAPAATSRGLCNRCYRYFRNLHPPVERNPLEEQPDPRPMPVPTASLPGTEERLFCYMRRAERGERLFHPDDARNPDGESVTQRRPPIASHKEREDVGWIGEDLGRNVGEVVTLSTWRGLRRLSYRRPG